MIYYVEDDANIRELTVYTLKKSGFETVGLPDAHSFFAACQKNIPEAILLDIMLPGKDGIEILKEIRNDSAMQHIPVMMLTAKGSEIDKVVGLDAGADDYLAKPFGMMELVSRVKALLRRAQSPAISASGKLTCGPIELDSESRNVFVNKVAAVLTLKEFDLLQMLMANCGHVLSREQLLESVWGWNFVGNTRTVDVHVQTLRQKLSEAYLDAGSLIETVRGVGYVIRTQ